MSSTVENIMRTAIDTGSSTTFATFDNLLTAAIDDGLLPQPVSYQATSARINFQFNEWLKANRQAVTDDAGAIVNYQQHLTAANFMAYQSEQAEQVAEVKRKREARWKVKQKQAPETWADLFAVPNWQAHLDILCDTEPPLLVKDGDRYLPANGVSLGEIAFSFYQFKIKGKLKVTSADEIAKALTKLLPDYIVAGSTVRQEPAHYKNKFEMQILTAIRRI